MIRLINKLTCIVTSGLTNQFPGGWTVLYKNENMTEPRSGLLSGSTLLKMVESENQLVKIFETIYKKPQEKSARIHLVIYSVF